LIKIIDKDLQNDEIGYIFEIFDNSGDGSITLEEFQKVFID